MKISSHVRNVKREIIKSGAPVRLSEINPADAGAPLSRKAIKKRLHNLLKEIDRFQEELYAEQKQSFLIVLQGMDTGGKDGVIRNVIRGMSPQGVTVTSFKQPTPEEKSHDFLWRIRRRLPSVGQVGVFNRSHYEDIVSVRMMNLAPEAVWRSRYKTIRDFEKNLSHPPKGNPPTKVIKFFLHISQDEQWKRLLARMKEKPWKLSESDFLDLGSWKNYTKKWNQYQTAWEDAINETNTGDSPWYIIPADDKEMRDLLVAETIYKTFKEMHIAKPRPKVDLKALKRKVAKLSKTRAGA